MSIGDADFGLQVGIGVAGRVVMAVVAFLGSIVLARELGPDGYGAFYLLLAVVAFLDNPVTGWARACAKRFTEADFPTDEAVGAAFGGALASVALVLAGAWALSPVVPLVAGLRDTWLLLGVLFGGVVTFKVALATMEATAKFGASSWLQALRDVLRVPAQVALVLAGYGVAGMVGGMVLANLLVVPAVVRVVEVRPRLPGRDSLRHIWGFARASIPRGFVSTAYYQVDLVLLGVLASTAAVGTYEVAMKLTLPATFVAGVASASLMGRISDRLSEGRDRDVVADVENNLSYSSLLSVPIFFGALVLGERIVVTVYGGAFRAAAPFLVGIALFQVIRSQRTILASAIDGFDRPDLNLRTDVGVFAVNLILGVALLLQVGPIGVVVATLVAEAVSYLARSYLVRSLVPAASLLTRPFIEQVGSGLAMALAVLALREAFVLDSAVRVVAVVGVGAAVYLGLLALVSEPFRVTVRAVLDDAIGTGSG